MAKPITVARTIDIPMELAMARSRIYSGLCPLKKAIYAPMDMPAGPAIFRDFDFYHGLFRGVNLFL